MASHEGSRKRLKMSQDYGKSPDKNTGAMASASNTGPGMDTLDSTCHRSSCQHEQGLKTLNTDIDAMRQLVTCKICDRLLYEPYSISCGHTYCYQCLRQWFDNNKNKKTCPDCRMRVTQQPTPSYILRELVLVFTSRNELLPDGETTEEHHKWSKEEADLVTQDKTNTDTRVGGLFRGLFKGARAFGAINDAADGVDRCPSCTWELEGPFCGNCGLRVEGTGFSDYSDDSDLTDDELDHEIDAEDAAEFFGADGADDFMDQHSIGGYISDGSTAGSLRMNDRNFLEGGAEPQRRRHQQGRRNRGTIDLVSDEDDDQEGESDEERAREEMQGFLVDDDEEVSGDVDSSDEDTDVPRTTRRRRLARRGTPVVISDDDDEEAASAGAPVTEEDSEDEGPVARGSQRNKRSGRVTLRGIPLPRVVDSSSPELSDDDEGNGESNNDYATNVALLGGFSPLDRDEEGDESHDGYTNNAARRSGFSPVDDDEEDDESDEESEVPSSIHPMYASDDDVELDVDDLDDHGVDDDDDDGWGSQHSYHDEQLMVLTSTADTELETPHHPRPAAMAASHRLHTRGQHSERHTSFFGGRNHATRSHPPAGRSASTTIPSRRPPPLHPDLLRIARNDTSSIFEEAGNNSRSSRGAQSASRAPSHPFQLSNTLASVNSAYNQRAHQSGSQRNTRRQDPQSSSSSGSSRTVGYGNDGRRKRALSIDSDGSVGFHHG